MGTLNENNTNWVPEICKEDDL